MKKRLNRGLSIILGIIMLAGAIGHIAVPDEYAPLIPTFISQSVANILAAIAEGLVALALFVPKFRKFGGLGFTALMIAFLPIHVWDLLRDDPYITSTVGVYTRLLVQFLFIYTGWWIYKASSTQPNDQSIQSGPQ